MNKELSSILKSRIIGLPFLDVVAGLVQTVEQPNKDGTKGLVDRFPVSYDYNGNDASCRGRERDLIPNSARKSITYFEDFGSTVLGSRNGILEMSSNIRLICWLNRDRLTGDSYAEISGPCIAATINRLSGGNPLNMGMFTRLKIKPIRVPEQAPALFSRYTYDVTTRQYLRPPFEVFGIDLVCTYSVHHKCINDINFNIDNNC